MRKTNPDERGVEGVEKYLAGVSEPARSTLQALRRTIRAAAPAEAEEVISYGIQETLQPLSDEQPGVQALGARAEALPQLDRHVAVSAR
jgi:hypothetical protein